MRTQAIVRRAVLGAGLLIAIAAAGLASSLFAETASHSPDSPNRLFLFVDWFHVQKGELKVTLDPERLSAKGKALLEKYERDFHKSFDQGRHGSTSLAPFGVRIVQEVAQHGQPWLAADQPWEQSVSSPTVLFDEGRYRCWYVTRLPAEKESVAVDGGQVMSVSGSAMAYAESKDGITWAKPSLGILSYNGSRVNNLVCPYNVGGSVFRDDHGAAEERYKAFQFAELPNDGAAPGASPKSRYGLYGISSADGLHWKKNAKPLIRYFADTTNIAAWDPQLQSYVGFFRHHLSGRTISRAETTDFWNWPEPQPLLYAGPMDRPADDYYTSCYTTYPGESSLRLIFPAIYHRDSDKVDVRLGISRDGRAFQWASYDAIIQLGPKGSWNCGSIYAQPQLVNLPDGRLALPYGGCNGTHNEVWFKNFYEDYNLATSFGWALWQEARLAGIEADEAGQFAMHGTPFQGERIQINARTATDGRIEIELRQNGKALEGFAFADCEPFQGDKVWSTCRWKNGANVSRLRGKSIEVCFRLHKAKLFACRFN